MLHKKDIVQIIQKNDDRIKNLGVKRVGVFGSFATSIPNRKSDVDILVEFNLGEKTFDNYMELKFLLQRLLNRKVDLVIKDALKPRIKHHIIKEAVYARL